MEHSQAIAKISGGGRATSTADSSSAHFIRASAHPVLSLQRIVGNRAVQRLIQAGLEEANGQESPTAERAPGPIVNEVLNAPGEGLDPAIRTLMESHFGVDFSGVRVHTDAGAAESAGAIHAHAYTSGQDLVFAEGRYAPGTAEGQRLLAHELTHVVQQAAGPVTGTPTADGALSISEPTDVFEQAADVHADGVMAGASREGATGAAADSGGQTCVQCQDASEDLVDQAMGASSDMGGAGMPTGLVGLGTEDPGDQAIGTTSDMGPAVTTAGGGMDPGGNLGFPGLGSSPWMMGMGAPLHAALSAGQAGISTATGLAGQVPGLGGIASGVGNLAGQAGDWLNNLF